MFGVHIPFIEICW